MNRFGSSFWILCLTGFLAFVSYDLIRSPLLPLFAETLGASPQVIGVIVGISTITGIIFKLPAGTFSDVVGRKPLIFTGLFVFAAAPPLYFLVDRVWMLLALRSFHGFATAIFAPVALAIVADRFPETRGAALGWYSAFGQAGRLSGRMAGGFLVGAFGFGAVFGVCTGIGVILMFLFFLIRLGPREGRGEKKIPIRKIDVLAGLREIVGDSRVLAASGMEAVLLTASGALMAFLPLFGLRSGLSPGELGLLFGAMGVASITARPAMGYASDRLGRIPLILSGQLLCAGLLFLLSFLGSFKGLFLFSLAFGFSESLIGASTSALVADLCRRRSLGAAMGVFGTLMDIGHAAGPILAGLLISLGGFHSAFGGISLLLLAMTALFFYVFNTKIPNIPRGLNI